MSERPYGKYRHHRYVYKRPFTAESHHWELVGPLGAIHFHASVTKEYGTSCGLEYHHTPECNYRPGTAPDHIDCPLTGGRCWHDGTSMHAQDNLWPRISAHLQCGDHEAVFRILEREADDHFEGYEILAAREGSDQ